MKKVSQFDVEAWHRLLYLYHPLVYRWCRASGLEEFDVADVIQEVFLSVSQGLIRFLTTSPRGTFRAWLWGITRHKLADHYRRKSGGPVPWGGNQFDEFLQQFSDEPPENREPAEKRTVEIQLLNRAVALLRSEFSAPIWNAFWRTVVEQEATRDVAEDLGMTPQAVRQARYRVLRRFRLELQDLGEDLWGLS